jgi:hypothetical protein
MVLPPTFESESCAEEMNAIKMQKVYKSNVKYSTISKMMA